MKPILLLLLASPALAGDVAIDGHTFRVPDGFTVERVAGPPLVNRPIVADFDERGRLYVADSSGSNEAPDKQLANPTHRIVRLEDTDGDGKYDKSIVFADKMMFPEGAMWRDGSLYVAAPPSIWKLTDTDGDGICDKREEWFKGRTLTGCANDLHGPYNGPDGWIYWCKGAFAEQTYTLPNGKPFKTRAAHIFRAKPDGSNIEPVITGGMDNPVEIAWSPGGEMFFTSTFVVHPGGGQRDGIVHGVYGGVYGKDHDVLDGHIRTGPDLMPIMTHLGPAAPSGLMRYESSAFGTAYKDNLFCAQFNMHKVSRHILEPVGATFKTTDSDFLSVAEHHDFHPTDVLEDADGSILVLDTGGWYKLCCPTSQIGRPDVLGAIYRVRRIAAAKVEDSRGLAIDWASLGPPELAKRLDDPRAFVRRRAVEELSRKGNPGLRELTQVVQWNESIEARLNAVWASARLGGGRNGHVAFSALHDPDSDVKQAAWRALSLARGTSVEVASKNLDKVPLDSPHTARAAAEWAGRSGGIPAAKSLMEHVKPTRDDRILEHSLRYALVEINAPESLVAALADAGEDSSTHLMIALDQLGALVPVERLKAALESSDTHRREVAEWIAEGRPEYGDMLVGHLSASLIKGTDDTTSKEPLNTQLARFAHIPKVAEFIGTFLGPDRPREYRVIMLDAIIRSGVKTTLASWRLGIVDALESGDRRLIPHAVHAAHVLALTDVPGGPLAKALRKVIEGEATPNAVRLEALSTLPGGPGELSERIFEVLRAQTGPDLPVATRLAAAGILAKAQLSSDQLTNLADALRVAGPLDVAEFLPAFDRATNDAIGRKVVEALKASPR